MNAILRMPYLMATVFFIVTIYALCAIENYNLVTWSWVAWLVNEQFLTNSESSFFEVLSAVAWLTSVVIFVYAVKLSGADAIHPRQRLWLMFYCVLAVFAFGEEISWGDHLFDYSHDLEIVKINAQKETNIHNINLAKILAIPEDSPVHKLATNAGFFLTPLFYVLLAVLWCLLPLVKQLDKNSRWRILVGMPVPSNAFIVFFLVHAVIFIATDILLFNVGQIFEMFISLAAIIVGLDILNKTRQDA